MKKMVIIILMLCIVFSCATTEEIMDEITFVPGISQSMIGYGVLDVHVTGEYAIQETLNGKRIELPIIIYNYSPSAEFGLIVDSIIINGWDTKVDIPMHKRVSAKGKLSDNIHFYLSGAGIENISEIDSIILKCSMYNEDFDTVEMFPVKIHFYWLDGNVFWENDKDVFHTHYDCTEKEAFFLISGPVETAFEQGHSMFCETCRKQDGFDL